jgi:hypothetical protein
MALSAGMSFDTGAQVAPSAGRRGGELLCSACALSSGVVPRLGASGAYSGGGSAVAASPPRYYLGWPHPQL